jgi:hypothetical protein
MARTRAAVVAAIAAMACVAVTAAAGSSAEGAGRALYEADALTISVDRAAREVRGSLVADSTYWHMCWGDGDAHVKIRRVEPGRDKLVAEDPYTDWDRNWKVRFHSPAVKGKRIYAEIPGFGNCAPISSRIVQAP